MLYAAEAIRRGLIDSAFAKVSSAAGNNDLVSKKEQTTLARDLSTAADAARAEKGPGARITVNDVIRCYSNQVTDELERVNKRGVHWLSARETREISFPTTRAKVWDLRARMASDAVCDIERGADGRFRRELSPSFNYDGSGKVKVAFFDADSTLRVSKSGSVSANDPRDVKLLPFVADRLAELAEEGYLIAVVSNQGGVAAGFVSMETADEALKYTADLIHRGGGNVHYMDFAEARDQNRKPNTGMADRLELNLKAQFGDDVVIDKEASFMCGDSAYKKTDTRPDGRPGFNFSNSDRKFAINAGLVFHEPQDFFGWKELGSEHMPNREALNEFWSELG